MNQKILGLLSNCLAQVQYDFCVTLVAELAKRMIHFVNEKNFTPSSLIEKQIEDVKSSIKTLFG